MYSGVDTWYPSWGDDDVLYSPWADGVFDGLLLFCAEGEATFTPHARIEGGDMYSLDLIHIGTEHESAAPYAGRYPCATLMHDGIWYYGTYLVDPDFRTFQEGKEFNWPIMGPMPGFRISYDKGQSWTPSPCTPSNPLFPEPESKDGAVRIGSPFFVDFGKNMEHSPDGKAYIVAQGSDPSRAQDRYGHTSWVTGDQVYLIRVVPSPETINDIRAYEFFAGYSAQGEPQWSSEWADIQPLLDWPGHMGRVHVTYNAPLKKYLMSVTDGWPTVEKFRSYILESVSLTGPWKLVTYMKDFGEQAYFLNFPTKFISPDGVNMWLWYSANFRRLANGVRVQDNPPGSGYGLAAQKVELIRK